VIIDTNDRPAEATVTRFLKLAKGDEAKLLVVIVGEAKAEGILDLLKAKKAGWLQILKLDSAATAKAQFTADALRLATGVWLFAAGDPSQAKEILGDAAIVRGLREVRLRGGVVAASGAVAWLMPSRFLSAEGKAQDGFDVLPGMLATRQAKENSGQQLDAALAPTPAMLGISLGDGAALLVSGREMRALGNGPVSLSLARSATREPRKVAMRPNGQVDYNEMRRAALGRAQQTPYPPKEVATPEVPKGTLIIVGGGGMGADISKRFVELGGGADGTFVVLPISNPDPLGPRDMGDGFLRRLGAKNILVLKAREQKELEDPKNIEILKKATAVWFGGGRQWRFVDAYEGTKIHDLFRDVLRRGGVIGGSSAGATIQGDYLCRGAPGGPNNIICEGYERALGFLPGVAIDQHFTQRDRFKDMVLLMKTYPQFLGIGLDEATAIVVQGHVAEVMGPNQVHFYDRRKPVVEGKPDHESFKAGARYDLKERKSLAAKEAKETK
jgi:cyanophycinase